MKLSTGNKAPTPFLIFALVLLSLLPLRTEAEEEVLYQARTKDRAQRFIDQQKDPQNLTIKEQKKSFRLYAVFVGPFLSKDEGQQFLDQHPKFKSATRRVVQKGEKFYLYLGQRFNPRVLRAIQRATKQIPEKRLFAIKKGTKEVTLFSVLRESQADSSSENVFVFNSEQIPTTEPETETSEPEDMSSNAPVNFGGDIKAGLYQYPSSEISNVSHFFSSQFFAELGLSSSIDLKTTLILERYSQAGDHAYDQNYFFPGESYLRKRWDESRLTAGYQKLLWGRVFIGSFFDRLTRWDLRQFISRPYKDRHLPQPLLRYEWYKGSHKLDLAWSPAYQNAVLPAEKSLWLPYNQPEGHLLGVETTPVTKALTQNGTFERSKLPTAAFGLRWTYQGDGLDFGVTAVHTPQPMPYFALYPDVRTALLASGDVPTALAASETTFERHHETSTVAGIDGGFVVSDYIVRYEMAYDTKMPVTTESFEYKTTQGYGWATSIEFYPGDSDTVVNLQVKAQHLLEGDFKFLNPKESYSAAGLIRSEWLNAKLRTGLRFLHGITFEDNFLAPFVSYDYSDNLTLDLSYHHYSGEKRTLGYYFEEASGPRLEIFSSF